MIYFSSYGTEKSTFQKKWHLKFEDLKLKCKSEKMYIVYKNSRPEPLYSYFTTGVVNSNWSASHLIFSSIKNIDFSGHFITKKGNFRKFWSEFMPQKCFLALIWIDRLCFTFLKKAKLCILFKFLCVSITFFKSIRGWKTVIISISSFKFFHLRNPNNKIINGYFLTPLNKSIYYITKAKTKPK